MGIIYDSIRIKVHKSEPIDEPIRELIVAMNFIAGIETKESCCGHGKEGVFIRFSVDPHDPRGLFLLTRSADPRYWEFGHRWFITLAVGDSLSTYQNTSILPIWYMLSSTARGEAAYKQAQSLVESIKHHMNHKKFMQHYLPHFRVRDSVIIETVDRKKQVIDRAVYKSEKVVSETLLHTGT